MVRHEYDSPEGWFEFSRNAGPTQARVKSLSSEDRHAMKQQLLALIDEYNQADDGSVVIDAKYLVVVARKRG
jgi:hypothetical protein